MRKTKIVWIGSIILASCAQAGNPNLPPEQAVAQSQRKAPNLVVALADQPASPATQKIERKIIRSDTPQFVQGGYWRITGTLNVPGSGTFSSPNDQGLWSKFVTKVKDWLWSQDQELLITAKATGEKIPELPYAQIFHVQSSGQVDQPNSIYFNLTPPLPEVGKATIQFSTVRADKVQSNLVSAVTTVLATAVPLLDKAVTFTEARRAQMGAYANTADSLADKLFSVTNTKPVALPITPFETGGDKAVKEIRFYVGSNNSNDDLLFTIRGESTQTLIVGSGLLRDIPANSTDIKEATAISQHGQVSLDKALLDADMQTWQLTATDTRETTQEFCRRIDQVLRSKLGLAENDRLALTWAYLTTSLWARKAEGRPDKPADDACDLALEKLKALNSPLPQLKVPTSLRADYLNSVQRKEDWDAGTNLREKLIPIAIQLGDQSKRTEAWSGILDDWVTIGAHLKRVKFSDTLTISRHATQGFDKSEAANVLTSVPISWRSSRDYCFEPVSWPTSRRAFRAKQSCVYLGTGEDADPMAVVFVLTQTDPAKIAEIRLFSD